MKKLDVSVLTIMIIVSLLATLVPQTIVRANNESDEIIEFKDENFKKFLKNRGMDRNNDGEITKGEMEQATYLGLTYLDTYNIKNIDEIKYAKNITELMISYFDLKSIDLTQFKNLKYFEYKCKDEKDAIKKENINLPDNLFIYGEKPFYENSYVIRGYRIEDITIYENEYSGMSLDHARFDQNGIIDYYNGGIVGVKEGTEKVKYEGNMVNKEITVTVKKSDLNSNPDLENTGLTAKRVEDPYSQDKILQSNGNLWSFDDKSKIKLDDTKVRDVASIYSRNNYSYMGYYLKLKDDNTLNIVKTENSEQEPKQIKNVKQIVQGVGCGYSAYLTTDNTLYYVDPAASGDNVYRKVDEQVEKVMGSYYVKGGKTYFVTGQKVLDTAIDQARGTFCVVGNTLYTFDISKNEFLKIDTEFKEFSYDEAQERSKVSTVYLRNNGEQKQAYYKNNAPGEKYYQGIESYTYRPDDYSHYGIRLADDNNLYMEKELLLLTNVYFTYRYYSDEDDGFIAAVRTDGTIWLNSMDNIKEFKKVEQEQNAEVNSDELVEEFASVFPEFGASAQNTIAMKRVFAEMEITNEQAEEFMAKANELKQLLDDAGVESLIDLPEEKMEQGKQILAGMVNAVGLQIKFQNGGIQFLKPNGEIIGSSSTEHVVGTEEIKGDIDGDNDITAFDAYSALELSLSSEELTEKQIKQLDIDKDGSVTAFDSYLILSYSVGIVDETYWGSSN